MAKVTYIQVNGEQQQIDVPVGQSIMHAAILNNIAGIEAECGGSCSCATCHVYLADSDMSAFEQADEMEDELLEGVASERKPTSRLSCQLVIDEKTTDVSVFIPEAQY